MQVHNIPGCGYFVASDPKTSDHRPVPVDLDRYGNPVRRRRVHCKSRSGCDQCKKKRRKCDETLPTCQNCKKTGQVCTRDPKKRVPGCDRAKAEVQNGRAGGLPGPEELHIRNSSSRLDLLQLKLLHHFEQFTADTLVPCPELWKRNVLPLALENDFLMHAVLATAASHLRYLQPNVREHQISELTHISSAYEGLRLTLSGPWTQHISSAAIACSMLLLHIAWTWCPDHDGGFNSHLDPLFTLAFGLKSVVLATLNMRDPQFFSADISTKAIDAIAQDLNGSLQVSQFEDLFVDLFHRVQDEKDDVTFPTYMDGVRRLIPALVILEHKNQGTDLSILLRDIARYLFLWPVRFHGGLTDLASHEKRLPRILLLFFYSVTSELIGEQFWWAKERSEYHKRVLSQELHIPSEELGIRGEGSNSGSRQIRGSAI
ncbi:hypothetical protein VTN96DRAFT_1293 [Rasamsonia emersonii]